MTAKKIFKIIGILITVFIALILLFFGFIWGSIAWNRYSKKKEAIRYQKAVCDTIKTVQGNFEIMVNGFTNKEVKKINFYLQRNKRIVKDTTINFVGKDDRETQTLIMPFKEFNINDRIILVIKNRTYLLSGFSYMAVYNYGMFGPVGPCHCATSGYQNVNGKPGGSGLLLKNEGLVNYKLP